MVEDGIKTQLDTMTNWKRGGGAAPDLQYRYVGTSVYTLHQKIQRRKEKKKRKKKLIDWSVLVGDAHWDNLILTRYVFPSTPQT